MSIHFLLLCLVWSVIQYSPLSWYHGTASSTHSTASWYSFATWPTMSRTCPWTPPFQSPSSSLTVGAAAVVEVAGVALFPSLPTLHILLLQPAAVLILALLPARGPPVHSNSQVRHILWCTRPWLGSHTIVFVSLLSSLKDAHRQSRPSSLGSFVFEMNV